MNLENHYILEEVKNKTIAIVIDGFINGYGIIRSLYNHDIYILVICKQGAALAYSNKVNGVCLYNNTEELAQLLREINSRVTLAVPYYCSDLNLKLVLGLQSELTNFSIHPLDLRILTKETQLKIATNIGMTVPKSFILNSIEDFYTSFQKGEMYILKPAYSNEGVDLFKAKISNSRDVMEPFVQKCIEANIPSVLSIYIPGDDTSLYTFGGYAKDGKMIESFAGRKISQRPRYNGVASMAESIQDEKLIAAGTTFIKKIGFTGIFQIEFKVDIANQLYYFIEFNPRHWSWGYVATINGHNLPLAKFYTETKNSIPISMSFQKGQDNFYFWLEGILYNMIKDGWISLPLIAIKMFFSKKVSFAFWSITDPKPYLIYLKNLVFFALGIRKTLR